MLKNLTVLATAAAVLFAVPLHTASAKHKKHVAKQKPQTVRVARQAGPGARGANLFPAGPVYFNGGLYMGDDPDPFIRSQLLRDLSGRFGGEN